jgi:exonuclease III
MKNLKNRTPFFIIPLILTALLLVPGQVIAKKAKKKSFQIMSYNVENLFDDQHDLNKDDWQYLPLHHPLKEANCLKIEREYFRESCLSTDWSLEKLRLKLTQIKKGILSANNYKLPDFLAIQEVENEKVVGMLSNQLGYDKFIMTDSPDKRGIDVALLYKSSPKFELMQKVELTLPLTKGERPTRNILVANFLIQKKYPLSLIVVHWPSQSNPAEKRVQAASAIKDYMLKRRLVSPSEHFVITGDFNVVDSDYPHPFKSVFEQKPMPLFDMHDQFHFDRSISRDTKKAQPLGSYFYFKKMQWNRLDRFFVSTNLTNDEGLVSLPASYKIHGEKLLTRTATYDDPVHFHRGTIVTNAPKRYDYSLDSLKNQGYSDHFPVSIKLVVRKKRKKF